MISEEGRVGTAQDPSSQSLVGANSAIPWIPWTTYGQVLRGIVQIGGGERGRDTAAGAWFWSRAREMPPRRPEEASGLDGAGNSREDISETKPVLKQGAAAGGNHCAVTCGASGRLTVGCIESLQGWGMGERKNLYISQ